MEVCCLSHAVIKRVSETKFFFYKKASVKFGDLYSDSDGYQSLGDTYKKYHIADTYKKINAIYALKVKLIV